MRTPARPPWACVCSDHCLVFVVCGHVDNDWPANRFGVVIKCIQLLEGIGWYLPPHAFASDFCSDAMDWDRLAVAASDQVYVLSCTACMFMSSMQWSN